MSEGAAFLSPGEDLDLTTCDREPIHIPGAIQPHGLLVVLEEPDLRIIQISGNAELLLGESPHAFLGEEVSRLLGHEGRNDLAGHLEGRAFEQATSVSFSVRLPGLEGPYQAIVHRTEGGLVVELEPGSGDATQQNLPPLLEGAIERLQAARSLTELCEIAAREVRRLTGFDRIMIYRFDEDWNGRVVAEERASHAASYLGLHFPATDIPAQARRLYTLNRTRLIVDAAYTPALLIPPLNPRTAAPLDLTYSTLRSVSPIHLEYLHNMGVQASMSISILQDGRLWGLIACHHAAPLPVPHTTRAACGLLGQVLALLLAGQQEIEDRAYLHQIKETQGRLLEAMIRAEAFTDGLLRDENDLLQLVGAQGVVLCDDGVFTRIGHTPDEPALRDLVAWLAPHLEAGLYATHTLGREYPPAEAFAEVGSGLLAVSLSRLQPSYLLWFRPELPETVAWAGEPGKAVRVTRNGTLRLHPRKSFATWQEVQRGRSEPWRSIHLETARALRDLIVDVVFFKMEQIRHLNTALRHTNDRLTKRNQELQDFVYIASHDLQEPLRKIRTFADLLATNVRQPIEDEARLSLDRLTSAAGRMSQLVADLLDYSQVTTRGKPFAPANLASILRRTIRDLAERIEDTDARIEADPLPVVEADAGQIRKLFYLLLDNALKYRAPERPPHIRILAAATHLASPETGAGARPALELTVADNGIGFDARHRERIFSPFQQLHARASYSGTGMGLALCRRIVERHGGTISAESVPGEGSRFHIVLPLKQPASSDAIG